MPPREFRELADRLPDLKKGSVWLAQCSPRWASDGWLELRDRIDDALLECLVQSREVDVHRIVLYDLPEGMREGPAGDRHREWVTRLRRDQTYLGIAMYELTQVVLATDGPNSRPPPDLAAIGGRARFDELKQRRAFDVTPTAIVAGDPYPDLDPLFYLDLDVRDTDRLQLGREHRRRRRFAQESEAER